MFHRCGARLTKTTVEIIGLDWHDVKGWCEELRRWVLALSAERYRGFNDTHFAEMLAGCEVIDVTQDPLGKQARRVARTDWTEVWSRPLWDGTVAVGLFNRGPKRTEVVARWSHLGLRGRHPVRDLWQQKDLGVFGDSFTAQVPAHGAALVKVGR